MNDMFYVAATGMNAQQLNLDNISNNMTNVSTNGFKKSRVTFQDIVYHELAKVGDADPSQGSAPTGPGAGVMASAAGMDFTPGNLNKTGVEMDLAIHGTGFLEVMLPDGSTAYTRGGTMTVGKDGALGDAAGNVFKASITMSVGAKNLNIAADGTVTATLAGAPRPTQIGHLELMDFPQAGGLEPLGGGLYRATETSGDPIVVKPSVDGAGTLAQGFSEASNVNLNDEMVNLMMAQRSYGISAKMIQAADQVMGLVNGLFR